MIIYKLTQKSYSCHLLSHFHLGLTSARWVWFHQFEFNRVWLKYSTIFKLTKLPLLSILPTRIIKYKIKKSFLIVQIVTKSHRFMELGPSF